MRRGFGFNAFHRNIPLFAAIADDLGISLAQLLVRFPDTALSAAIADENGLDAALTTRFQLAASIADDLGISLAQLTVRYPNIALSASLADDLGISRSVLTLSFAPALLAASIADDLGLTSTLTARWRFQAAIADDLGISTATLTRLWKLQASIADDTGLSATLRARWQLQAAIADDLGISTATLRTLWKLHAAIADDTGVAATLTRLWKLRATVADDLGISRSILTVASPSFATTFIEDVTSTSTTATLTFTARSLAAADPNRFIVIAIHTGNNARSITSVTIGGVTATQVTQIAAATQTVAIFYAFVPTGTTGNIVIARSAPDNNLQYMTWKVVSPTGLMNVADSLSGSPATQGNHVLACQQGGSIFGIVVATSPTITNYGVDSGPDANNAYAIRHVVVSADNTTFTGSVTAGSTFRMALASLYP